MSNNNPDTIYEAIGGQPAVNRIVDSLYTHIGANKALLQIFPDDLGESARKQRLFLTQLFGGPSLYLEDRGHPMLKRRHLAFEITPTRRDAWLTCMHKALHEAEIDEPYFSAMFDRLTMTAHHMVNTKESST